MKLKQWMCYNCGRRGESKEDVVMKICAACISEMTEVTDDRRFKV